MTWVLDASAVICWLSDEPGAVRVEQILGLEEPSLIHAVNLVEVEYLLLRCGEQVRRVGIERMDAAGIEIDRDLDDALLATAIDLKAHYAPIALGDTFAVALAAQRGAQLATTDHGELDSIAAAGICRIEFLR
jgi:PIN domain nuclease of toxin-antitoxin system